MAQHPQLNRLTTSFGREYIQWKFECQLINKAEDRASRLVLEQKRKNVIQKGPRGRLLVAKCLSQEKVGALRPLRCWTRPEKEAARESRGKNKRRRGKLAATC